VSTPEVKDSVGASQDRLTFATESSEPSETSDERRLAHVVWADQDRDMLQICQSCLRKTLPVRERQLADGEDGRFVWGHGPIVDLLPANVERATARAETGP